MSTRQKRQKISIKDVAREAGVSYATVSRVINNYPHVSQNKREQVLKAMTSLGYVANKQARSLAGGRSHTIGLLVPGVGTSYIGQVMIGIDDVLAASQYDLMLYTTNRRRTHETAYVATMTRGLTDGLLLLVPLDPQAYLSALHEQDFPYVVVDHQGFDDYSPTVIAANYQGAYEATEYLIGLGHRRIGFIVGIPVLNSSIERHKGYKDALAAHHIPYNPDLVRNGEFDSPQSFSAANELLDLPEPPTAIFAASDLSAFGAADAIRSRGLNIPGDVSLMGFDDLPEAAWSHPALTTVRQPLREMGRIATRMLLDRIMGKPIEHRVLVDTELIIRNSCQPPKA